MNMQLVDRSTLDLKRRARNSYVQPMYAKLKSNRGKDLVIDVPKGKQPNQHRNSIYGTMKGMAEADGLVLNTSITKDNKQICFSLSEGTKAPAAAKKQTRRKAKR